MAEFHFVEDYERHVRDLMALYPSEQAMSLAVGGGWQAVQAIEVAILRYAGLRDGDRLVDLGCGAGRLAQGLGASGLTLDYLGLDVVEPLLDYARQVSPPDYRFALNRSRTLPVGDASLDMLCAFSVFTHLLPEETYVYLEDAHRALRQGGIVVMSFLQLDLAAHWGLFEATVETLKTAVKAPLNTFLSPSTIATFATHLDFDCQEIIPGDTTRWNAGALGQSVAILSKGRNPARQR